MLAALVAFLLLWLPHVTAGEPFSDLGFDAALAKAKDEKKLLLVDFTATWCGPCRKMEKDTWAFGDVRAWLAENAIAIQVDVDVERDLAKRFRIGSMPTVVAMLGTEEFDRAIGYKDAAQFLAWARDVRAGKRSSDELIERSKALRESTDIRARYDLARDLAHAGKEDEALHHYLWLWPATRAELGFGGVRTSFMLGDMASLAKRHEPSKKAFDEIFAELQASVDAEGLPSFDTWQEWTAFCRNFDGNARVVAWYEKRRDERGRLFSDRVEPFYPDEDHLADLKQGPDRREGFLVGLIVAEVFDVLMEEERFLDAVRLYDDAGTRARALVNNYELALQPPQGIEELDEELQRYIQEKLIQDMSRLYGALLMAERYEEADAVAASLLEKLDAPEARLQLVYQGLSMTEKPRPSFELWLNEAEASGSDVEQLRWKLGRFDPPKDD